MLFSSLRVMSPCLLIGCFICVFCFQSCATHRGEGAVIGAGLGALIGHLAGGEDGALIGAGIGVGSGFIIGGMQDSHASTRYGGLPNDGEESLAGSTWRLFELRSSEPHGVEAIWMRFNGDGTVNSEMTRWGSTTSASERYRTVGSVLIVNQDDYVLNMYFDQIGNQLTLIDKEGAWKAIFRRQ